MPFSPRPHGFYSMNSKRHGVALIINNKQFKDRRHKTREGTDRDEENLTETWQFLGYHVIIVRDRKRDEMARIFLEIDKILKGINNIDVRNDSFVCCILSHGKEGEVYGSDSKPLEYTRIQRYLAKSKILASRPKVLFIQACQGSEAAEGVMDYIKDIDADDDMISEYTDFYLSCASVDGYKAFRSPSTGMHHIVCVYVCVCVCMCACERERVHMSHYNICIVLLKILKISCLTHTHTHTHIRYMVCF